jgi:hypothetical protein
MEDVAIPYADKERQKAYNKEYRKKYYQKNKRKIQDRINSYRRKKRVEYRRGSEGSIGALHRSMCKLSPNTSRRREVNRAESQ